MSKSYYKRRKIDGDIFLKLTFEGMCEEYPDVFNENGDKIKLCNVEKCSIFTKDGESVVKDRQMVAHALKSRTKAYIDDMAKRGIIKRTNSNWRNPIRAIEKPNGDIRVVGDLMPSNSIVEKDPYMLGNINEVINATRWSQ